MPIRNVVVDDALLYVKRWGCTDFTSGLVEGETQYAVPDFVLFETVEPIYCKVVAGVLVEMTQGEKDAVDEFLSPVTSVPLGSGYTDIRTSEPLCTANNTARGCAVGLGIWEIPASKVDMGDQLAFHVARLNDGTVFLRCLTDGQTASGAVPLTLTGYTAGNVGWRIVIDSTYCAVVGVDRDASINRWAQAGFCFDTDCACVRSCP